MAKKRKPRLNQKDAVQLANAFLAQELGRIPRCINAQSNHINDNLWALTFDLSRDNTVFDGSLLVVVDITTRQVKFPETEDLYSSKKTLERMKIRKSTPTDSPRVLNIWRRAVDATHHFLTPEDRRDIEAEVVAFLPDATLDLAVDDSDNPIAFMLLSEGHMEALFVDPDYRGKGVGRLLVEEAVSRYPNLTTDVNEQNPQAIGFYEKLGFERCGRSELDGQGRAYPLIHLRWK